MHRSSVSMDVEWCVICVCYFASCVGTSVCIYHVESPPVVFRLGTEFLFANLFINCHF